MLMTADVRTLSKIYMAVRLLYLSVEEIAEHKVLQGEIHSSALEFRFFAN